MVWLSVRLLWKIDLKRRVFLFFSFFFFDRSFLVGSSESHWGESSARKETWRSGSCGMCCCCSCLGFFFFLVYIAMIVMCTMWLDGWWWPWLSIFVFALAKPFNNFQNASRVCRRAVRIQMIFMLARVCTHFVKQKPLKPLKPLSWFILLTVECGFLFWVSSPGSSSRW